MVPLTWSFCPRRATTLSPRNDRARYICDPAVVAPEDRGALFREAKDTFKGVVLKMHWIRTIESFYLGRAKKRSNESAQRNGWASHSRGTIGHGPRERIIISPSVRYANKLKTVTHGLTAAVTKCVLRLCRIMRYHMRRAWTRTYRRELRLDAIRP